MDQPRLGGVSLRVDQFTLVSLQRFDGVQVVREQLQLDGPPTVLLVGTSFDQDAVVPITALDGGTGGDWQAPAEWVLDQIAQAASGMGRLPGVADIRQACRPLTQAERDAMEPKQTPALPPREGGER